jgi:hypothetical protein
VDYIVVHEMAHLIDMRQVYLIYSAEPKLHQLVGEISWTNHLVIIGRCQDALQREFYILITRTYGCSQNALIHQIENQTYRCCYL